MKSYFNRTAAWNARAGVKTPAVFTIPDQEEIDLMRDLMVEEVGEMHEARTEQDLLDAFADQLFVMFGNMARYGIDFDKMRSYFVKVVTSNESKFANTIQEAEASIKKEAERLGIDEKSVTFVEIDGKYVIINADTGKILKSVNYVEPYNI